MDPRLREDDDFQRARFFLKGFRLAGNDEAASGPPQEIFRWPRSRSHRIFNAHQLTRGKLRLRDDLIAVGLCAILCLGASASAHAQTRTTPSQQSAEEFVLLAGKDTVIVEDVQHDGNDMSSALDTRGRGRYILDAKVDSQALVSRLEVNAYAPVGTTPTAHVVIAIVDDSVFAQVETGIQRTTTKAGAIPWLNPSFSLLQLVIQRARHMGAGTDTVPLFLVEGGTTVASTVTPNGLDSTDVTLGSLDLRLHTSADGEILGGVIPSQNAVILRHTIPYSARGVAFAKPSYGPPASAPYTGEDVRVPTTGGFALAGTLTIPKKRSGRVAAVVLITGSGQEDRDEAVPAVPGYKPFRQIADTLSRRGIAVLRLDDRGYGDSGGDPSTATTADYANDIRAALAYLKSRPDIDSRHLFLVGHSEGGEIAPMIAASDASIAGIVTMAAPAVNGRDISRAQVTYAVNRDSALSATQRDSIIRSQNAILDSAAAHQPWVKYYLAYDPVATARQVRVPVLILQGGNDHQITSDQAATLAAAFRAGGDKDVTVHVFPELDHLLLVDPTGDPGSYPLLPSKSIGGNVLGTLADWIVQHSKQRN
jgi:alpha-beta hydrolase superfamily lysophospholipase